MNIKSHHGIISEINKKIKQDFTQNYGHSNQGFSYLEIKNFEIYHGGILFDNLIAVDKKKRQADLSLLKTRTFKSCRPKVSPKQLCFLQAKDKESLKSLKNQIKQETGAELSNSRLVALIRICPNNQLLKELIKREKPLFILLGEKFRLHLKEKLIN